MIWLHIFMEELGKQQENNRLYCDKQSSIHLAKKSVGLLRGGVNQ